MMASNILVTGKPGIGKTTLVEAIAAEFESHGFLTREIRDPATRKRTGFSVVDIGTPEHSAVLARLAQLNYRGPHQCDAGCVGTLV